MANYDANITVNVFSGAPQVTSADYTNICVLSTGATFASVLVKQYLTPAEVNADTELDAATMAYAVQFFAQPAHPKTLRIAKIALYTAGETELPAILAADPAIRAVCTPDRTKANLVELAAAANTAGIKCVIQSEDVDILTNIAGNLFVTIKALTNNRTMGIYHKATTPPTGGYAADLCALAAGLGGGGPDERSFPLGYTTLVGIPESEGAAVVMTNTERAAIETAGGNTVANLKGVVCVGPGKMLGGFWWDRQVTTDWIGSRIGEDVAQAFLDAASRKKKIPMNDYGIAILEGVMRERMLTGAPPRMPADQAHFSEGSVSTSVPKEGDITVAQRNAREMPALSCGATFADGVNTCTIAVNLV